jgi:hypothetical protein
MKIIKQLSNKVKSIATGVSTFIPTQLSFWYGGQYVTNETMNTFSKDLYEKLALLTTNVNNFPVVIFSDGGVSKFSLTSDKKFIDLPALACAFQLQDTQGNNLPYKPYVIGYIDKQRVVISTGTLTNVLYVYSSININNIDPKPTNAPTPMQLVALTTTPDNNKDKCLLCIIKTDGSIDFSQTNFLVNSAVTTTSNTELLNPQNKINTITPQALSLFSNLGHVDAFDERVRANGGYAKGRIIRELEDDIYWVYYQSLIDNNMNDKPYQDSHVGWFILNIIYIDPDIENRVSQIFPSNAKNGLATQTDGEMYAVSNDATDEASVLKENLLKFEKLNSSGVGYNILMELYSDSLKFNYDNKVLMRLSTSSLTFYGLTTGVKAFYDADRAFAPYFEDAQGKLGSSDNNNPEYTYLGGGNVIIQGVVTSNAGRFSVTLPRAVQANVGGRFPPVQGDPIITEQIDPTLMQSLQVDVGLANGNTIVGSVAKYVNGSPIPLNIDVGFFLKAKLV